MSNNEKNNNDGFGRGITLIVIGIVALMVTFFDFDIDWHMMSKLWPLLLIIIGVCVMPINKWLRTVIVLVLIGLGLVAYQTKIDGCKDCDKTEIISSYSGDDYDDDDDDY